MTHRSSSPSQSPFPLSDTPFAQPRGRVYPSFVETVGGTPLVGLPHLTERENLHAHILLKLEFFNPLGSVKDRIGVAMLRDAQERGIISPHHSTLVEPTSGNTGIALAFAAASMGYKLIVTMPESASIERRKMMTLLGATLKLTPAAKGMRGAIEEAEEIVRKTDNAWMPSQFQNPANPHIHATTTAEEIWQDTDGAVDVVIAGLGTGGTASGIAQALKKRKKGLEVIGLEPMESAILNGDEPGPHGIQGIGAGFKPETLDLTAIDRVIPVAEHDALATSRLCARTEGLPIGISSGASLFAAMTLAREERYHDKIIVAIAPSFAERYLSTPLFSGL
ncbi:MULTISPECIES: cysteine synthase A [unclassified Saccharibacter]|uniref:cysteine synthase A n=1 Tax=unclassified Saccharibacter TaxID=2648722 RepID=UPI001328C596|nr:MULTISPECIES: cysteine synthase A [unclassified Saccharibacter]MXV36784.1 cysteine synthase A [Saccharibacter sp. EH611]MXV58726.1 cysteine synthase A [Saccharibacter sp. EH70]MXV66232.1 cysteine synthase A [Saccharibacter sp. EH60]